MGKSNTPDDFWKFVDKKSEDECWKWLGCFVNNHGRFSYKKQRFSAHRFSYFLNTGYMPVHGDRVFHTCNNSYCVNPNHLVIKYKRIPDQTTHWRKVISYEQTTPNGMEYKFELSCGHIVTRFFTKYRANMPTHLMCSQCWWKSNDSKSN